LAVGFRIKPVGRIECPRLNPSPQVVHGSGFAARKPTGDFVENLGLNDLIAGSILPNRHTETPCIRSKEAYRLSSKSGSAIWDFSGSHGRFFRKTQAGNLAPIILFRDFQPFFVAQPIDEVAAAS
jgi:hypothetical protein